MPKVPPKLTPKQWKELNESAGYKRVKSPGVYGEYYDPNKTYQKVNGKDEVVDLPYISYTAPGKAIPDSKRKAFDFQYRGFTGYKYDDGTVKYLNNQTGEEMPQLAKGGKVKGYADGGEMQYGSNDYFDKLNKTKQATDGISGAVMAGSAAVNPLAPAILKGAQAGADKWTNKDAYGVSDNNLALFATANPGQTWGSAFKDISHGKFTAKTAANLFVPGLGAIMDNKERRKQRDQLAADYDANQAAEQAAKDAEYQKSLGIDNVNNALSKRNLGLKDGGKIIGKGTAKSDSIPAKMDKDSFIVPAENAEVAEELREKVLKKPLKKAPLKSGNVKVKLSDGEHEFTKEEVEELQEKGVNLNLLAPNAKTPIKENGNFSDGTIGTINPAFTNTTTTTPPDPSPKFDYTKALDYGLPLLQAGIGLNQLQKLGKRPTDQLDPETDRSIEAARQNLNLVTANARFGYTPEELSYLTAQNQNLTQGERNNARNMSGGSASNGINNERLALIDSFDRDLKTKIGNRQLLLDKQDKIYDRQAYLDNLIQKRREDKRRLFTDKLGGWNTDEQAAAGLLGSGINNLSQASRYRNEVAATDARAKKYNTNY